MSAEILDFSLISEVVKPIDLFVFSSTMPLNQVSVAGSENLITAESDRRCAISLLS